MATWTVVYHGCLIASIGVGWALVLEGLALSACLAWRIRRWRRPAATPDPVDADPPALSGSSAVGRWRRRAPSAKTARAAVVATVVLALGAAVAMAVDAPWSLVATTWLLAALIGTAWAYLDLPASPGSGDDQTRDESAVAEPAQDAADHRSAIVALVWAVLLAVVSLSLLRPNPDDVYYLNLSQWVADHGTFPVRDTIFSNLVYPMSAWPPMASYDALVGTVAHVAGVRAAAVAYLAVPPVATALSVLALWRLLRAWRVKAVGLALSSALIFLVLDNSSKHTPATLFVSRLWQGKVVFLCLMVPVLLVYAVRYLERPTRERAGWLFLGGVAAVGMTTTAMFLVPLIAAAGMAPLVVRSMRRAAFGYAAMAGYALAAGVVTKAVGGRAADDFVRGTIRFEPSWFGHQVFADGVTALVAVAAVLLGVLLVPHPAARVTTGLCAVFVGITYIPGFTHLSFDLVGLGPTLWRMSWLVTAGALVGVAVTRLSERVSATGLRAAGPVGLAVLLVVFGDPVWSGATLASWDAPLHYQRPADTVGLANRVIREADPGDLVLAPTPLSLTITVLTTTIHTVDPRDYFMDYLSDNRGFQHAKRVQLAEFVSGVAKVGRPVLRRDLRALSVDVVCLDASNRGGIAKVARLGYRPSSRSSGYRCLVR